jgi:hypothetical protein
MSLEEVAREVKRNLPTDGMRVIGDPKLPVSKVVRGVQGAIGARFKPMIRLYYQKIRRFYWTPPPIQPRFGTNAFFGLGEHL